MSESDPTPAGMVELNRRQAKRLRFYFTQGNRASVYSPDAIDLALVALKVLQLEDAGMSGYQRARVTEIGIQTLHQHRQSDIKNRGVHHELGSRLAAYLREQGRITWENIEFKNLITERNPQTDGLPETYSYWKCVRPDVFSMAPSLDLKRADPRVHEVKVSRADYFSDLAKPEKRSAYASISRALYFVTPAGLIKPEELPPGAGLMQETTEGEFEMVKRAKKTDVELQPHHFLNLILKPGIYPPNHGQ